MPRLMFCAFSLSGLLTLTSSAASQLTARCFPLALGTTTSPAHSQIHYFNSFLNQMLAALYLVPECRRLLPKMAHRTLQYISTRCCALHCFDPDLFFFQPVEIINSVPCLVSLPSTAVDHTPDVFCNTGSMEAIGMCASSGRNFRSQTSGLVCGPQRLHLCASCVKSFLRCYLPRPSSLVVAQSLATSLAQADTLSAAWAEHSSTVWAELFVTTLSASQRLAIPPSVEMHWRTIRPLDLLLTNEVQ